MCRKWSFVWGGWGKGVKKEAQIYLLVLLTETENREASERMTMSLILNMLSLKRQWGV